ncbi:MAG TPA: hypothetical protein VNZ25_03445, partial [Candidatus Angelobacter sp.]|nr:hypothetical protein [Candidatus Angelobacter sp.]
MKNGHHDDKSEAFRRRDAAWTIAESKQLGSVPDSVLARRTGRTIREVVAERERQRIEPLLPPHSWTTNETKMLGCYSDMEVARRLRRNRNDVRRERIRLGIPPLRPAPKSKRWTREEEKLLGT